MKECESTRTLQLFLEDGRKNEKVVAQKNKTKKRRCQKIKIGRKREERRKSGSWAQEIRCSWEE